MIWPRWMTLSALTVASSAMAWGQMSLGLHSSLRPLGGDRGSWIVHYELSGVPARHPELPELLQAPWVYECSSDRASCDPVVWHEVWDTFISFNYVDQVLQPLSKNCVWHVLGGLGEFLVGCDCWRS